MKMSRLLLGYIFAFIILLSWSISTVAQEATTSQPDLSQYVVYQSGATQPARFSAGRALFLLVRQPDLVRGRVSISDVQVLEHENSNAQDFQKKLRNLQRKLIDEFESKHIRNREPKDIDVVTAADALHGLSSRVDTAFQEKYEDVMERLSPEGRKFIVDEVLPFLVRSTRQSYLDYRALARDHPDYLRSLFTAHRETSQTLDQTVVEKSHQDPDTGVIVGSRSEVWQ